MRLREMAFHGLHDHLFASLPELPPGGGVLDIACGTGAWLTRFQGRPLAGIDRHDTLQMPAVEYVAGDIDYGRLDLGRTFALVSAIEIIEHLENPGRLVALASRHLAPDGWFLLSTPNVHSALARSRWLTTGKLRFFDDAGDPTHITPITRRWAEEVLPRHGLEIVRLWGWPDRGSRACRPAVDRVARVLGATFPMVVEGDSMCILARPRTVSPVSDSRPPLQGGGRE